MDLQRYNSSHLLSAFKSKNLSSMTTFPCKIVMMRKIPNFVLLIGMDFTHILKHLRRQLL